MGVGMLRRYHTQEPGHVNGPGDVEASEQAQVVDEQGVDDMEHAAGRPDDDQSTPFDPVPEYEAAEGGGEQSPEPPAGNASQKDWAAYRIGQGMDPATAEALSRDELRDRLP